METPFNENICAQIKLKQKDTFLVCVIYRSPSHKDTRSNEILCKPMHEVSQKVSFSY